MAIVQVAWGKHKMPPGVLLADTGPADPQCQLWGYLQGFGGSGSWRLKGCTPDVIQKSDGCVNWNLFHWLQASSWEVAGTYVWPGLCGSFQAPLQTKPSVAEFLSRKLMLKWDSNNSSSL